MMARYDDLSTGPIAYAAFVSTVILLVVILLTRALCYSYVDSEDAIKLTNAHYVESDAEIARQKARIATYAKVEVPVAAAEGDQPDAAPKMEERLHIPVARAEQILLKDWTSTEAKAGH
jgi:hypothetical protein